MWRLYPLAETVAAAAVWWDAHRLGITYGGPTGRDGSLGAPGWGMLTLFVAPVAVPLYLWRRRRWLPRAGAPSPVVVRGSTDAP